MTSTESNTVPEDLPDALTDLGPLAWVLDETRRSIHGATKALRSFAYAAQDARGVDLASVDANPLRLASQKLHQVAGALEMVGQAVPAQMVRGMEAAANRFIAHPETCSQDAAETLEKAGFALVECVESQLGEEPRSPVGLFAQYQQVQKLARAERIHPADLWTETWSWREPPRLTSKKPLEYTRTVRYRIDRNVLKVMSRADLRAAARLVAISRGLAAGETQPHHAAFWALAAGFFEALSQRLVPIDLHVKRTTSHVLLQYAALARGDGVISERLALDMLFFCAQAGLAPADAPALAAVRATWDLDARLPVVDYAEPTFGLYDPDALAQARRRVESVKENWSALAGGDTLRLRACADQLGHVADSLRFLHGESRPLAEALDRVVGGLRESGEPPSAELAMETATSLLFLEASFTEFRPQNTDYSARLQVLANRLDAVREGGHASALEPWMEGLYRRISDRQTMGTVVGELRLTLGEAEQLLDRYFRDPSDRTIFAPVSGLMTQIRGVLSVLGLDHAVRAVTHIRGGIEELIAQEEEIDEAALTSRFETLGNSLGALGFLTDTLSYQPALARSLFYFDEAAGEFRYIAGRVGLYRHAPELPAPDIERVLSGMPAEPEARVVAEEPLAPPAAAPGSLDAEDDDAELLDIFLDEASEVVRSGAHALEMLQVDPDAHEHLTVLRRAFHTLKGSSRMVGLAEFGEAAWSLEQLLNDWLAEQKPADDDFLAVAGQGLRALASWREDLVNQDANAWRAAPFTVLADALRMRGERVTASLMPVGRSDDPGIFARNVPDIAIDVDAGQPGMADKADDGQPLESMSELIEAPVAAVPEIAALDALLPAELPGVAEADETPEEAEIQPQSLRPAQDDDASDVNVADSPPALPHLVVSQAFAALPDGSFPKIDAAPESPVAIPEDLAVDLSSLEFELDPAAVEPIDTTPRSVAGTDRDDDGPLHGAIDLEFDPTAARLDEPGNDAWPDIPLPAAEIDLEFDPANEDVLEVEIDAPVGPGSVSAADIQGTPGPEEPAEAASGVDAQDDGVASAWDGDRLAAGDIAPQSENDIPGDELAGDVRQIGGLRISTPLYNVYLNEADSWSARLEEELSGWAKAPAGPVPEPAINHAHSLAGSSATVGFVALSQLAMAVEHALQRLQSQDQGTPEQARVLCGAAAEIRKVLHQFAAGILRTPSIAVQAAVQALDATADADDQAAEGAGDAAASVRRFDSDQPDDGRALTEDIDAVDVVDPDLFPIFEEEAQDLMPRLGASLRQWAEQPKDLAARAAALRVLHTLKGSARLAGALRLGELAHRTESVIELLDVDNLVMGDLEPLLDDFDLIELDFQQLRRVGVAGPGVSAQAGRSSAAPAKDGAEGEPGVDIRPDVNVAPGEVTPPARLQLGALHASARQSVRVQSRLLDRLMAQAGELMSSRVRLELGVSQQRILMDELAVNVERLREQLRGVELQAETQMQSRLAQSRDEQQGFDPLEFDRFTRMQELTRMMAESVSDVATLQRNLQRVLDASEDDLVAQARQSSALQDDLLRTRMVEFDAISERLYRVVRQTSKEQAKRVRLDLIGGNIEIDRGILDRMMPSFEHLLRNCVVHGIESEDVRLARGKNATGLITVSVQQAGNDVAIEFRDDGAGLDADRIRERALERGLVDPDQELDEQALSRLVFEPGFSTATEISELAGRGVGMDVVETDVQALGGRIETQSQAHEGTAFRLVLPLTTAVTHVVMLRAGDLTIGVPASLIEVVRRVPPAVLSETYEQGAFEHEGESLPFYWTGALLQHSARSSESVGRSMAIVVFRSAAQRVALHVDEVLGNQEVVVKSLGPQLSRLPGLVAITALASGAVALIYNPVALGTVHGERALALAAAADAQVAAGGVAVADAATPPTDIPLVLVVDDSITVRRVTQRLLQREGYRVALAADGLQALAQLQQERPAVVLSDIEMPRMDGFDFLRNVRADEQFGDLPVIMITSRIADKHREHAAELGANHYLGKPYSEDELLRLIGGYAQVGHDRQDG